MGQGIPGGRGRSVGGGSPRNRAGGTEVTEVREDHGGRTGSYCRAGKCELNLPEIRPN